MGATMRRGPKWHRSVGHPKGKAAVSNRQQETEIKMALARLFVLQVSDMIRHPVRTAELQAGLDQFLASHIPPDRTPHTPEGTPT